MCTSISKTSIRHQWIAVVAKKGLSDLVSIWAWTFLLEFSQRLTRPLPWGPPSLAPAIFFNYKV